jgi:hypothetical protein
MPEFEPLKDYHILKHSLAAMTELDCVKLRNAKKEAEALLVK